MTATAGIGLGIYPFLSCAEKDTSTGTTTLDSRLLRVEINDSTGQWALLDKRSGVRWPSSGLASPGDATWLAGDLKKASGAQKDSVRLVKDADKAVVFSLADGGAGLELRYEDKSDDAIRVLGDAVAMNDTEDGAMIVPCREGMLVPANSGKTFKTVFPTSDYEPGSHYNVFGFMKAGSALMVTWDDAYTFPEIESVMPSGKPYRQQVTATFELRKSARSLRLTPLGKGDWNVIAAGYRGIAEKKGTAVTLREKISRNARLEKLVGALDFRMGGLSRRKSEDGTKVESVVSHTFEEMAQVAEHLRKDVDLDRCLVLISGWINGGYDVRHPDVLPANPECGGNEGLVGAVKRIQALDYVASLHDNYQDMYKDAKSWSPDYILKNPDGSLIPGGHWQGGQAYLVCAPKQLELARRPQNLPEIKKLFPLWSYFVDTTLGADPEECYDPKHPIGRNEDIAWKQKMCDYARSEFGIFGSEDGREWAIPHSDFFEGFVGVNGLYFHHYSAVSTNRLLKMEEYGATVIPFFEMIYHDCILAWGKYGYSPKQAAESVAHNLLCARTHYYHAGNHLYWKSTDAPPASDDPLAAYVRTDNGWAQGLHFYDVFMKNTHEILGPLHSMTAHDRLTRLDFLTPDKALRQATYGQGANATKVIVNYGAKEAKVTTALGKEVVLPAWGFVVEGPRFAAFYALEWGGQQYENGALFTLRAMDQQNLGQSRQVRVFHGFGPATVNWKGKSYEVPREQVIRL